MTRGEVILEIDLGNNGGVGRFRTLKQLVDWAVRERRQWDWLVALPEGGRGDLTAHVRSQLEGIVQWTEQVQTKGNLDGEDPQGVFLGYYGSSTPRLLHSKGSSGRAILTLRQELGDRKAALAYALLVGTVGIENRNPEHTQLLTLVANPTLIGRSARELAQRERFESAFTYGEELSGQQAALLQASEQEWQQLKKDAAARGMSLVRRALGINQRSRMKTAADAKAAIDEIKATEAAFGEHMQLAAAVDYWEQKRATHETSQRAALGYLWKFGVAAALTSLLTFAFVVALMLEMSGVEVSSYIAGRAITDPPLPTATYLVLTAAVGTILTALFWVGRVLLRIYLSERSLRTDAEERKVMTKTYLALLKEGAALKEEDRLVVLNALFRSTGDGGASADGGGGEVALPALIARLMEQRT